MSRKEPSSGTAARATSPSRTQRRLDFAVAVLYLAGVLLALTAIALEWANTGRIDRFNDLVARPEDPDKPRESENSLWLGVTLTSFDADTGVLKMTLDVDAGLMDRPPREDIVLDTNWGADITFPLVADDPSDPEWGDVDTSMRMFGTPRRYPQDTYEYDMNYRIAKPSNLVIETFVHASGDVLLEYKVLAEIRLRQAVKSVEHESYRLTVKRPGSLILFTYTMAFAPFLLLVGIVAQFFRYRSGTVFTAEAGLTVLALLPLRQVLVPDALRAPTRVDLVLATELTLFIAVAGAIALLPRRAHADRSATTPSRH